MNKIVSDKLDVNSQQFLHSTVTILILYGFEIQWDKDAHFQWIQSTGVLQVPHKQGWLAGAEIEFILIF